MSSSSIKRLEGILPEGHIEWMGMYLHEVYEELKMDSCIPKEKFDFAIQKETVLGRILSYRFCNEQVMNPIIKSLSNWLSKNILHGSWYLNPLLYLKICRPGLSLYPSNALLYTEPHYDKTEFGNIFQSFWVPLYPTSYETGGLCEIDLPHEILLKEFPKSGKNRLDLMTYLKQPEEIDLIIHKYIKNYYCSNGDVLTFGPNCLHGATKPTNKNRISINFQFFHESDLNKISNFEEKKIRLAKMSLDTCNAINLYHFGDNIGAKKILENKLSCNSMSDILKNNINKIMEINNDGKKLVHFDYMSKVHWRQEYSWLRNYIN
jgi:hypothetical protein